jgi:hypothetical protein
MSCILNPAFWVYLIVLIGGIMIIRLVVPWFIAFFAFPEPIGSVINIILWIVIACAGVYFLFALLSCFFGSGLSLPSFPASHR